MEGLIILIFVFGYLFIGGGLGTQGGWDERARNRQDRGERER